MSDDPKTLAESIADARAKWREVRGILDAEKSTAWKRLTALCTPENLGDLAVEVLSLEAADQTNQELISYLHNEVRGLRKERDAARAQAREWQRAAHTTGHELTAARAEVERLRGALTEIADFGHAPECDMTYAPVYECCCFERSQWEIARAALGEGE